MMPLITRIGGIFMLFLLHKYFPLGGGVISLIKDTAKNRRVVMAAANPMRSDGDQRCRVVGTSEIWIFYPEAKW